MALLPMLTIYEKPGYIAKHVLYDKKMHQCQKDFRIILTQLVYFHCRYLVEPTAPDASKINPVERKISTTSNYYESVDDVPKKSPGYQVTIYLNIKNIYDNS